MSRALSDQAVEQGTGRTWAAWVALFDAAGGDALSHDELVAVASNAGAAPWWRQMVSVTYEQHLGRRAPGQGADGTFAVSASRTLPGSLDEALTSWERATAGASSFSNVELQGPPQVSRTPKWRYWRCALADGSRVIVNIGATAPGRAVVSVQHERLVSAELSEHWRAYWKGVLATLT